MNRRRKPPNCSFQRTRMPPIHYPSTHSAPLNSSLGSRGNFLTNSNDTEAEKRVNNVIVTKRRSHKAASQDWGRASRYALIELPRKPSAAKDKGAPNMGIQRTRIPASRYPFAHSGPLIPGVRRQIIAGTDTTLQAMMRKHVQVSHHKDSYLLASLSSLPHTRSSRNYLSAWLNDNAASQGYFRSAITI